jgi:molybdopterin converting factor small subunit
VTAKLQEKIQKAESTVSGQNEERVLQQLRDDAEIIEKHSRSTMKHMTTFVNRYYPAVEGKMALSVILEELMNKCINTPHDPYLNIKEAPPEYVELLLRTGICIAHNDNYMLIKLAPFNF